MYFFVYHSSTSSLSRVPPRVWSGPSPVKIVRCICTCTLHRAHPLKWAHLYLHLLFCVYFLFIIAPHLPSPSPSASMKRPLPGQNRSVYLHACLTLPEPLNERICICLKRIISFEYTFYFVYFVYISTYSLKALPRCPLAQNISVYLRISRTQATMRSGSFVFRQTAHVQHFVWNLTLSVKVQPHLPLHWKLHHQYDEATPSDSESFSITQYSHTRVPHTSLHPPHPTTPYMYPVFARVPRTSLHPPLRRHQACILYLPVEQHCVWANLYFVFTFCLHQDKSHISPLQAPPWAWRSSHLAQNHSVSRRYHHACLTTPYCLWTSICIWICLSSRILLH